jgi:hypothetical protein
MLFRTSNKKKLTARTPGTPGMEISRIVFPGDPGVLAVQDHILETLRDVL